MILMNTLNKILQVLLLAFLISGCTDWLTVEDMDKFTESQVFTSETNIQQALNGIYIGMGENTLYGRDLSVGTVELLGQQYALSGASSEKNVLKYSMLNYVYSTETAKSKFLSIWTKAYSAILNVNNFINKLDKTEGVITTAKKDILLGEAYGLRAYLHLDLLRLFGPVYLTDSTSISIPYRKEAKIEYNERIAANEVMGYIMSDLNRSIDLLKNDPVVTLGVMTLPEDSLTADQKATPEFYRYRNRRINYYAASTLKVRALMYRNDKIAAAELAKSLLESSAVPEKFPWAKNEKVFLNNQEDRIFSTEVLFGVHASSMYENWTDLFSPGKTDASSLYAGPTENLEKLYELSGSGSFSLCNDWRSKNWLPYTQDSKYMVTYKLSKSTTETTFWYFQPLIRKAELYYTLAECERDIAYLNEVRTKRSVKKVEDIRPNYDIDEETQDEFRREMFNEGQIFFYYKRRAMLSIPNGSSSGNISMSSAKYIIPIPNSELDK